MGFWANLFQLQPAWMNTTDEARAVTAVASISDQATLEEIAKTAHFSGARVAATKKITNQDTLFDIAVHSDLSSVREAALENISDKSLLTTILAQLSPNDESAIVAVQLHIGDESSLSSVVQRFTSQGREEHNSLFKALFKLSKLPGERSPTVLKEIIDGWRYGRQKNMYLLTSMLTSAFFSHYFRVTPHLDALQTLVGNVDKAVIVDACKSIDDSSRVVEIYKFFKIHDGDIIKRGCEIGQHRFELDHTYSDSDYATDEQAERGPTYRRVYKCKDCGLVKDEHAGR